MLIHRSEMGYFVDLIFDKVGNTGLSIVPISLQQKILGTHLSLSADIHEKNPLFHTKKIGFFFEPPWGTKIGKKKYFVKKKTK